MRNTDSCGAMRPITRSLGPTKGPMSSSVEEGNAARRPKASSSRRGSPPARTGSAAVATPLHDERSCGVVDAWARVSAYTRPTPCIRVKARHAMPRPSAVHPGGGCAKEPHSVQ